MNFSLNVPFTCPDDLEPFLHKVFAGEYNVPLNYEKGPPTILDCGANCGAFSVWASHRWPGARIHAYEPHPATFNILEGNLKCYHNVEANNFGIGTPGMRPLYDGVSNSGETSFHVMKNNTKLTAIHAEVRDPLILPKADILKMDVEGSEEEILGPLIAGGRIFDAICFEYHHDDIRRRVDPLLVDYVLIGSDVYFPHLGVLRYVRKDLVRL